MSDNGILYLAIGLAAGVLVVKALQPPPPVAPSPAPSSGAFGLGDLIGGNARGALGSLWSWATSSGGSSSSSGSAFHEGLDEGLRNAIAW